MKRKLVVILSFSLISLTLFMPKITNAADVESTLIIEDNERVNGQMREFYAGKHEIEISFDSWNSSICKSDQDTSKLTVNWHNFATGRNTASVTVNTHLYTCATLNFGTQRAGKYFPIFLTFDNYQNIYCGFKSNYVRFTNVVK